MYSWSHLELDAAMSLCNNNSSGLRQDHSGFTLEPLSVGVMRRRYLNLIWTTSCCPKREQVFMLCVPNTGLQSVPAAALEYSGVATRARSGLLLILSM